MPRKNTRICLRVGDRQAAALDRAAEETGETRSKIVRDILDGAIGRAIERGDIAPKPPTLQPPPSFPLWEELEDEECEGIEGHSSTGIVYDEAFDTSGGSVAL